MMRQIPTLESEDIKMKREYTAPTVELFSIKVEDILLESNELPEIDLHDLGDEE